MALVGSLLIALAAKTDQLEKDLAKARAEIKSVGKTVQETKSDFLDFGKSLTGLAAGALSVGTLTAAVKDLVTTGVEMKNLQATFSLLTGSAESGRKEFAFLRDTANTLGVDLKSLSGDYRTLAASTRGTNLEGEATRTLFTALTTASRNYGMSSEQTGRAVQAFSQIMSKGKVEQEELRGQLSEAIPGAMQIAARAFGVGTAELGTMVEKGLDASKFTRAFTEQLQREAPAATDIAGKGFAQLGNEILLFKTELANSGLVHLLDTLAAKGAHLLAIQRQAGEEATRLGREALGPGGNLATAEELRQATGLAAIIRQQPATEAGLFSWRPGFGQAQDARAQLATLQADIARRKAQQGLSNEMLLEAGLAPSQQTNRTALQAIEDQKEAERTKGRFNAIANRTDAAREAEETASREATQRAREAAAEATRLAREREQADAAFATKSIQLLREIGAEEERNIASLRSLAGAYSSTQERRDLDTASMLKAQLATSQHAAESERLYQIVADGNKVLAMAPQLQAEAERSAAALAIRQDATGSLERYEELLGLGMGRDARAYVKAKGDLAGLGPEDQARRLAVLRQMAPEFKKLTHVANEFADSFLSAIDRAVSGGVKSFKDFVGSVIMDLSRILQRQYLAPAFGELVQKGLGLAVAAIGGGIKANPTQYASAIGPTIDGGFLSGNKAEGGPVMRDGFYMVGERGPEIVRMHQGDYVYPNGHGPGGGNVTVNMTVYANDAGSFTRSAGEIQRQMQNAIRGSVRGA